MKKTIVVGVTGGIAAFKAVQLVSDLIKMNYDVEVIMSKNACEFIQPLSFESLTNHSVMVDTFDQRFMRSTQHISIAKKADCFVIVPATANVIAKVAHGLADDMLTTTFLACNCPKVIAPAMNTGMLENPITQANLKLCSNYGITIIDSSVGHLACGDIGKGKLADISIIIEAIEKVLMTSTQLLNKKVLISAGATIESIDPVRYITNHSTGKMGIALATAAKGMGADVTLVCGQLSVEKPYGITCIDAYSAKEMFEAIQTHYDACDILIMAAAVSDYRIQNVSEEKIKKKENTLTLELIKNPDILAWCGEHKTHQINVGFAMESENLIENAREKCLKKNCDLLVANNIKQQGAGFAHDTNVITLISRAETQAFELMSKTECANAILNKIIEKGETLC